jgi:hypothetical protein
MLQRYRMARRQCGIVPLVLHRARSTHHVYSVPVALRTRSWWHAKCNNCSQLRETVKVWFSKLIPSRVFPLSSAAQALSHDLKLLEIVRCNRDTATCKMMLISQALRALRTMRCRMPLSRCSFLRRMFLGVTSMTSSSEQHTGSMRHVGLDKQAKQGAHLECRRWLPRARTACATSASACPPWSRSARWRGLPQSKKVTMNNKHKPN